MPIKLLARYCFERGINKYVEFSDVGYIIKLFALKRRDNEVNRTCDSYRKATLVLLNSKFGGQQ